MSSGGIGAAGFLGDHQSGATVRDSNVAATNTLQGIMKTSLGPRGLDKMIVDQFGEVTITNDGAEILKKLEVNHPIGKQLVELSNVQDSEVGDGTTSVVVFAAELFKQAHALITKQNIHPTSINAGYKLARKEALTFIMKHMQLSVDTLTDQNLLDIASTTLSSKIIGADAKHFGQMCVDALKLVKTDVPDGKGGFTSKYPVKAINILKVHGQSMRESSLVEGYALERVGRAAQGMPMEVEHAKIALIDFPLRQHRAQMGIQVEISCASELEKIREMERDICKNKVATVLASGANVVFTTQGLDDLALKYLVEGGVFAVRRVSKADMKRLEKSTGGKVCISMTSMDQEEEKFDTEWLGNAARVYEKKVGDWDFVFVEGPSEQRAMTVLLRGANEFLLDETERSFLDALHTVSKTLESKSVVGGGGCVETAVSVHLENFAKSLGSKDGSAVRAFAEALLIIPKTLCLNAAADGNELVPTLRSQHIIGQRDVENYRDNGRFMGLDLMGTQKTMNMFQAGIIEPSIVKKKLIKNATEAAMIILRIDDIIKLYPEPEQQ